MTFKPATATNVNTPEQNGFANWLTWYMKMIELKPSTSWLEKPRIIYCSTVMAVLAVSGWTLFYQKYNDFTISTDILLHAVCTGHTLYLYLIYLKNRTKLCRIVDVLQDRFMEFADKLPLNKYEHVWEKADRLSLVLVKAGSYLCIAVYILFILNANVYSPQRKMLYPIWVPYCTQNIFNYFFTVALQLTVFSLYSFVHVSGHGMGIGGAHFIGASFEVLGNIFQDLTKVKTEVGYLRDNTMKKVLSRRCDAVTKESLRCWVQIHLAVLKIVQDYKSVYETIHVEVLLSCELIVCFCGFQMVLALERSDYKRMAVLVFLILLLTFHLFLFCYPGQHILNKSEDLRQALYLSDWQEQTLAFRKSMCILLAGHQRPVSLSYRGMVDASMPSFLHAMRTAFQYINILLILRDVH